MGGVNYDIRYRRVHGHLNSKVSERDALRDYRIDERGLECAVRACLQYILRLKRGDEGGNAVLWSLREGKSLMNVLMIGRLGRG